MTFVFSSISTSSSSALATVFVVINDDATIDRCCFFNDYKSSTPVVIVCPNIVTLQHSSILL